MNMSINGYLTWSDILTSLSKMIEEMKGRSLSFKGRILTAKSLLLSKIWYAATMTPPDARTTIQSLINNWIKQGKKILPNIKTFQHSVTTGGLNAPRFDLMVKARLASVWLNLLTSNHLWARAGRHSLESHFLETKNQDLAQVISSPPSKIAAWPPNWRPFAAAWRMLDGSYEDSFSSASISLQDITIAGVPAPEYTVRLGHRYLRRKIGLLSPLETPGSHPVLSTPTELKWHLTRHPAIPTNMLDVLWRAAHNSLPLKNRTRHFSEEGTPSCPWCPDEKQNLTHFLSRCRLAISIWEVSYKSMGFPRTAIPPDPCAAIFVASFSSGKLTTIEKTQIIIHALTIYEIWRWYTAHLYGETPNLDAAKKIWSTRLAANIDLILNNKSTSKRIRTRLEKCKRLL